MKTIRIFFQKRGEAAYISHLDLQRVMARALRRSGLPVWYSQGFNPHIYMSFTLPLSLLHESEAEAVDCKTESEETDFSAYIPALNASLPRGIAVTAIAEPVHTAAFIAWADWCIRYEDATAMAAAAEGYNALAKAPVVRKTKRSETTIDLKETLAEVTLCGEGILARLPAGGNLNFNPSLLLEVFAREYGLPAAGAHVLRKAVYTADLQPFC